MILIQKVAEPAEEQVWKRPGGTYRRRARDVAAGTGFPFEVELVTLPAGAMNWPYHAHSTMWECYYILSGHGEVQSPDGWTKVQAGDCVTHPPGEPHRMRNESSEDLTYLVIANNGEGKTTIHDG